MNESLHEIVARLDERLKSQKDDIDEIKKQLSEIDKKITNGNGYLQRKINTQIQAYIGKLVIALLTTGGIISGLVSFLWNYFTK